MHTRWECHRSLHHLRVCCITKTAAFQQHVSRRHNHIFNYTYVAWARRARCSHSQYRLSFCAPHMQAPARKTSCEPAAVPPKRCHRCLRVSFGLMIGRHENVGFAHDSIPLPRLRVTQSEALHPCARSAHEKVPSKESHAADPIVNGSHWSHASLALRPILVDRLGSLLLLFSESVSTTAKLCKHGLILFSDRTWPALVI
mmetsp:Transcript_65959/g.127245  ORF Transcript_65959/g.127245 Transcript_65959/m.127245 type:complete len:200 (+) Transcript_65959:747-1346(+)